MNKSLKSNTVFIEDLAEANEMGNVPALHVVRVPFQIDKKMLTNSSEFNVLFMYINRWIQQNANSTVYILTSRGIWKSGIRFPLLFFTDQGEAIQANEWIRDFLPKFEEWPDAERKQLFADKEDVNKLLNDGAPFAIAATIKVSLPRFDKDGVTDQNVVAIWNWIKDTCEQRVWRYDGRFVFESASEATLFKLRWAKSENEDEE